MTTDPIALWLLLFAAMGPFTLAEMDRALTLAEGKGASPVGRQEARAMVRALVAEGRLVEHGGRFARVARVLPPTEPKPVVAIPPRPEPKGQLALSFGGG